MKGALGHGNYLLDAINACDKIYLNEKMCMVGTPENTENEKQNKSWKMDISSSRYGGCTHDMNEEESCGSR